MDAHWTAFPWGPGRGVGVAGCCSLQRHFGLPGENCKPNCPEPSLEAGRPIYSTLVVEELGPELQKARPQLPGQAPSHSAYPENPTFCIYLFILGTVNARDGVEGWGHSRPPPPSLNSQSCQNRHPQTHLNLRILEMKFKFSFDLQVLE